MPTSQFALDNLNNEIKILVAPVREFEGESQVFIKLLSLQEAKRVTNTILVASGVFFEKRILNFSLLTFWPHSWQKQVRTSSIASAVGRKA